MSSVTILHNFCLFNQLKGYSVIVCSFLSLLGPIWVSSMEHKRNYMKQKVQASLFTYNESEMVSTAVKIEFSEYQLLFTQRHCMASHNLEKWKGHKYFYGASLGLSGDWQPVVPIHFHCTDFSFVLREKRSYSIWKEMRVSKWWQI